MRRTPKYVALDVHKSMTAVSVRASSGRVIARCMIPTEQAAIEEFFSGLQGTVLVTFEEGTQAQWLHDVLVPIVDHVVVCDRRGKRRGGNKSDEVDADELSELLRLGALRAVYPGRPDRSTLRELTRTYQNVIEDSTRVRMRIKALFRARALKAPGRCVYHPKNRAEWLAKLPPLRGNSGRRSAPS